MRTAWIMAALMAGASVCAAQGMDHDKDKSTGGSGVPAGFMGRTDRANANIADAKYAAKGGKWEITTGPAHIVYSAKSTATGSGYALSTSIDQLEAPTHPEAYGLFFGGKELDKPTQAYSYFIVRGDGKFMIKTRDGEKLTTVADWTANDAITKQDASGKATYNLKVHFAPTDAHFYVNDKLVSTQPRTALAGDGIYGLRVNHNLHVMVTPVVKQ